MSVFKVREQNKKKRPSKQCNNGNLSMIHQERMKDFQLQRERTADIQGRLVDLRVRVEELESLPCKSLEQLRELSEAKDECKSLGGKVARLNSSSDIMDYFYDTSHIITAYNDLEIDPTRGKVVITDFFRQYSEDEENPTTRREKPSNKKDLLEDYLEVTKDDYIRGSYVDDFCFCEFCDVEMTLKKDAGIYICTTCGLTNSIMVEGDVSRSSTQDSSKYSLYQRKNHFKEWLNQIQAKESTDIPPDVLDMVLVELNKIHFTNLADLTPLIIRKILKKLNLSKFYENTFCIIYRLNGLPPPTLSREVEEQLLCYFKQIEEPFRLYKKTGRKNLLRYSFVLHKLCELMELDEFLRCFRLLKNRNKLMEQDAVWASICKHLGWQFIPSV